MLRRARTGGISLFSFRYFRRCIAAALLNALNLPNPILALFQFLHYPRRRPSHRPLVFRASSSRIMPESLPSFSVLVIVPHRDTHHSPLLDMHHQTPAPGVRRQRASQLRTIMSNISIQQNTASRCSGCAARRREGCCRQPPPSLSDHSAGSRPVQWPSCRSPPSLARPRQSTVKGMVRTGFR